jgi:hypothetical protein
VPISIFRPIFIVVYKEGDKEADPNFVPEVTPQVSGRSVDREREEEDPQARLGPNPPPRKITEFFKPLNPHDVPVGGGAPQPSVDRSSVRQGPRKGTDPSKRGFNFCNTTRCRYCPKLNKTGSIESRTTGASFECMKNISCRSSNVIYCVTCKRCNMQYVGQTSLRVKDRFVHHFLDIEKGDKLKSLGRHFSQRDHNGVNDLEISVLEFIKKPPKSPAAILIRNRIETRWIHLLRTLAPQGLNMED